MLPWSFTLLCLSCLAAASEGTFSVTDDIFAYPQYELQYAEDYITLDEVVALLDRKAPQTTRNDEADLSTSQDHDRTDDDVYYEILTLREQPYFCTIPVVRPQIVNETKHVASEEETQKELARAADKGRELLSGMQGNQCLFYSTGWWTYSFCYNNQVRQFHALSPGQTGGRVWPPQEDPTTPAFVLGKADSATKDPATPNQNAESSVSTELQTKAETSYLVQRLDGGTQCDLTGKDRRIEIEFHCNPQLTDRIGWIKETATCAYLMVVYTPRLCSDVAFLPPKDSIAHTITCQEILTDEQIPEWEAAQQTTDEAAAQLVEQGAEPPLVVGGVEVGAMKFFKDGKKLERGRIVLTQDERAETIAMQKDGKVSSISSADLKKLELDPADIEKFQQELKKLAGSKDWKIERLDDVNGQVQLRGVVSEDEKGIRKNEKGEKGKTVEQKIDPSDDQVSDSDGEGSEEVYKEEI